MNLRLPLKFDIGTKVTYNDGFKIENGIIKSFSTNNYIFVVYHCDNKWDEYYNYTAQRTDINDLELGWNNGTNLPIKTKPIKSFK